MKYKLHFYVLLTSILLQSCASGKLNTQIMNNTLTNQEKKDGWMLLFDGQTMSHWHKFNGQTPGKNWQVIDGTMSFDPSNGEGGDIVTNEVFENFEFMIEWKIQDCGNSGIMYNVQEGNYFAPYLTGPEMQVLDNKCHPDAKITKHRAGDLYDMISAAPETVKPAGEWNQAKIVSKDGHMEFWLNGNKGVEFQMHSPEWDNMVANSKFKDWKDFGKFKSGKIALQDHGDKVWFRNIKIKKL